MSNNNEIIYGEIYDRAIAAVADVAKAHVDCCNFELTTEMMEIQKKLIDTRNFILGCEGEEF